MSSAAVLGRKFDWRLLEQAAGLPFAAFGETLGPAIQHAGLDARPAVYPVEQVMAQDGTRSS